MTEKNRKSGHDLFISFEGWAVTRDTRPLEMLKKIFNDYDVRIIHIYRDPMSHLLSHYNQQNKGYGRRITTKSLTSEILGRYTSSTAFRVYFTDSITLKRIVDIFGRNALHIVDLAGSATTGHDITYTVYCEVMGVLCDQRDLFLKTDVGKNPREDVVMMHVNSIFIGYLSNIKRSDVVHDGRGVSRCQYCSDLYHTASNWFERWYDRKILARDKMRYKIPTTQVNLSMLIPYMDGLVNEVWDNYGDIILHGDKAAVHASIRSNSMTETLDFDEFIHSLPWLSIFEEALEDARKVPGLLCNC